MKRILSWLLFILAALLAIALAMYLASLGIGASLIIANQHGLIENWALSLTVFSVCVCVYLYVGLTGGGWKISAWFIGSVVAVVVLLFLYGQYALPVVVFLLLIYSLVIMRQRQNRDQDR